MKGPIARRLAVRTILASVAFLVAGSVDRAAAAQTYNESKLPSPGLPQFGQIGSSARDINASGVIVGDASLGAAFWTPNGSGGYSNRTLLPSTSSAPYAAGINNAGVIVGNDNAAVVWLPSGSGGYTETFLTPPGGGLAETWNVNSGGTIVGRHGGAATVWKPNGVGGYVEAALPTSLSPFPQALHINDAGIIVGQDDVAVVWLPDASGNYPTETFLPLSFPASGNSQAWSVNASGVIAGQDSGALHAVVWTPIGSGIYSETVLPSSGAFPAIAFGISDEGLVVGEDGSDAAVWTPNGSGGYSETILPRLGGSGFALPHAVRLVAGQVRIAGVDDNNAVVWKGH